MGVSDIDEDEPPLPPPCVAAQHSAAAATTTTTAIAAATTGGCASNVASGGGGKVNLDDLFGPMGAHVVHGSPVGNNNNNTAASPVTPLSMGAVASAASSPSADANSVLDSLFAAPAAATAHTSSDAHATTSSSAGAGEPILYVDDTTPIACDLNNTARNADGNGNNGNSNNHRDAHQHHVAVNLLDLSQPVQRQRHESAESILAAFEQQGKRRGYVDDKNSLAQLTRNKDDNKVKARLLALMNYYDVLGVAPTATCEEIRQSYKKKALTLHPDKAGQHQTAEEAELFKIITKAHEVLTDDTQRSAYDAQVRAEALGGDSTDTASRCNWLQHLRPAS